MGDWLGTNYVAPARRIYRDYNDCKELVHSLNFTSQTEWKEYVKSNSLPVDIPNDPYGVYKREGTWIDWNDWLGYNKKEFLDYVVARDWARNSGIKSSKEWANWYHQEKLPDNMPCQPHNFYEEFVDWFDWLGKEDERDSFYRENGVRAIPNWQEKKQFIIDHATTWSNQEFADHFKIDAGLMTTWREKVETETGMKFSFPRKFNKGSKQASAKLNEELVAQIKTRLKTETATSLSLEFGVSTTTINNIRNNKIWKHVSPTRL